jgi:hypothetical protein
VKDYFRKLFELQDQCQYKPHQKFGMDKSLGMLGNGDSIVVAGPVGWQAQYLECNGNRKLYTIVATICVHGMANVALWFIFKAKGIAKSWAKNNSLHAM